MTLPFKLTKPLTMHETGPRRLTRLGNGSAIVLEITSPFLAQRHLEGVRNGASWDYPSYRPHITIGYGTSDDDVSSIPPYDGVIEFGPEEHKQVDENWDRPYLPSRRIPGSVIVLRPVINPLDLFEWARTIDFRGKMENPEDLHCTVVYSRRPLRKRLHPDAMHLRNSAR